MLYILVASMDKVAKVGALRPETFSMLSRPPCSALPLHKICSLVQF